MSFITTHVIDVTVGRAVEGLSVRLDVLTDDGSFLTLAEHATNADGKVPSMLPRGAVEARIYRLTFDTGSYFASVDRHAFFPWVEIVFRVANPEQVHQVPLFLGPFGYSTYRDG
jgi:5-hydroxyisourate hydrolase